LAIEKESIKQIEINASQNLRLQILEIQEKAARFIGQNPRRAAEYCVIGLELDPKNAILLSTKATALWQYGDLAGALGLFREIVALDPGDHGNALNGMEVALLLKDIDSYKALKAAHWTAVQTDKYGGDLAAYFDVLEAYQSGSETVAVKAIRKWLASHAEHKKYAGTWAFTDAIRFFSEKPASAARDSLIAFLNVLQGFLPPLAGGAAIDGHYPNGIPEAQSAGAPDNS
jgi:tetratricopeptide (TPR) repeat protein